MMTVNSEILQQLKAHDSKAFIHICGLYFKPLEDQAFEILNDGQLADILVTEVLGRLWASGQFAGLIDALPDKLSAEIQKICGQMLGGLQKIPMEIPFTAHRPDPVLCCGD